MRPLPASLPWRQSLRRTFRTRKQSGSPRLGGDPGFVSAQVRHHRAVAVLDVRREEEHRDAAIAGAVNVPIHELTARLRDVPAGEVWVHCASGYRASIAASVLDASGRTVVVVDDDFAHAAESGLPVS